MIEKNAAKDWLRSHRNAVFPVILAFGIALSYGFALIGEPQSLWLWRDVLGVVNSAPEPPK